VQSLSLSLSLLQVSLLVEWSAHRCPLGRGHRKLERGEDASPESLAFSSPDLDFKKRDPDGAFEEVDSKEKREDDGAIDGTNDRTTLADTRIA